MKLKLDEIELHVKDSEARGVRSDESVSSAIRLWR